MMSQKLRVTVWGENVHEHENPLVAKIYPDGMHRTIADAIAEEGNCEVRTATLQDPEHGLTTGVLENTDVLVWWGHAAHSKVADSVVERILARVWQGMGFIALHSSHYSKPFMRLMGTSCSIIWREAGEKERLWVCNPAHPIAAGSIAISKSRMSKCTANRSPCRRPMRLFSFPGSRAGKFSAPVAPGNAATVKSFTFVPATRPIPSITIRVSGWFCAMPFAGPQAMA